MHLKPNP
jgi:hypothetical protein